MARDRGTDFTDVLIANFDKWLDAYDRHYPFTKRGQREHHIRAIQLRRNLGSAKAALDDPAFLEALQDTLHAWGIGSRASRLRHQFVEELHAKADAIQELDGLAIDQPDLDVQAVGAKVARLIQTLNIVDNNARVVPCSKALHHLLPDLVVPIDRAYTQSFFGWPTPRFQYASIECFAEAFQGFAQIGAAVQPDQYVKGGWHTSRTKVIDNAIVGFICWIRISAERLKAQLPQTK